MDIFSFASRRSPVYGRGGMVATSQTLAVAAGLQVLQAGGNAADAAIATAAALNGSGRAPRALTLERLQKEGLGQALPRDHPYTITVPGAAAAWCDLVER